MPGSERMNLAIGLPLRNQAELANLLKQLVDPASPNFRQYLTSAQFAERFGPTVADYQTLTSFFEANGLIVTATHPNRTILDVSGTVADIESTFHVNMRYWRHATRGTFFAPDREPSLDAGVTILDVTGFDNFFVPRPMDLRSRPWSKGTPLTTGSGPAGLFIGNDFRSAYAPGVTLNGAGLSVGLFELDGFYASDVQANFKEAGLPPVPTQTVLLDGFNGAPGGANVEVTLDIMMASYMAPGLSSVIVYEGTNWNDVLNRMATDNLASQLSSSWTFSPTNATTEQIFQQMIAQGQSLFQASGDSGAYKGGIGPPADDPNVTVVGGTSLTTAGAGGPWQSETTWTGSGGGVSTTWPIPSYQQPVNTTAASGSATMRNIPDVALTADVQMFLVCNNGQWVEVGGTSAAAPLWAGFMALANQQAAANGSPRIGFLNPPLYALGVGSGLGTDLHDIITGNNQGFNALPGYDLATGWGTPAGQPLINALTGTASAPAFGLSLSATTLSIPAGASGVSVITVNEQNGFSSAVNLTASGLPAGVTAAFSPASAMTTSTLTLTAGSSSAATTSTITITGTSASVSNTTKLQLTVTAAPSFSLTATPASVSVNPGASGASTIVINNQSGFTGTVALAASGLPTGVTATFATVASAHMVTFTVASSALPSTATITITGTSGSLTAKTTIALTISSPPSFSLAATPASLSVNRGSSGATTIAIANQNGFAGAVALTASGLPAGVTATFITVATSRTVTFAAASSAAVGTSTVTITGASGSLSAKTTIALTIAVPPPATPPSFTLSAPASVSVNRGATGTSSITITNQNGFNGTVALTASGLPAGVTATFATVGTARVVTFAAAGTAVAGTWTVTITGTSGSLTARTTLALIVAAPPPSLPASFILTATPASISLNPGTSEMSSIAIAAQNGFNGTVTVTYSGLPTGVSANFSPGATGPNLTFTAASTAAPGTSTVTVAGTSGSLSAKTTIALSVPSAPSAPPSSPPTTGGTTVNLAPEYNLIGIVTDGAVFFNTSGLDGGGRAYSANLLGSAQTVNGMPFNIGPANAQGAVSGASIPLPVGQFSTLNMLAAGVNGNQTSQTFTVTYTDGTTSAFTQSLSDWCTPQSYPGESQAVKMTYRDNSDGTRDTRPLALYGYRFNIPNGKTVSAIALPKNRNVVVLAITLK